MTTAIDAPAAEAAAPPRLAQCFLEALCRRDFEALRRQLADDVWLRALLPRELRESNTAQEAVATLREWFGGAKAFRVVSSDHHVIGERDFISYRMLLKPDWAPERWHAIEQSGFCRVRDGRISRLDLTCTGFFPAEEGGAEADGKTAGAHRRPRSALE